MVSLERPAALILAGTFAFVAQAPAPTEKPIPVAPTIKLPFSTLKPDATIDIAGDRVMTSGDGGIWVAGRETGKVIRIDAKTNKQDEPIAVGKEPCAGLVTGFGSLIVPLCGAPALARVDLKLKSVSVFPRSMPATVAPVTAVSSLWIVSDAGTSLSRIDPDSNTVVADMPLGAKALALAFGQGALWIATDKDEVLKVSPYTIVTTEIIKVGRAPRSIAIGEGAVWTLNAADGSVSRIDTKTNKVANTIKLGGPISGGQIAVGEGSVWVSAPGMPLARIDPRTNHVVQQFSGEGGGAFLLALGAIWIATPKAIWRLDPKLVEATINLTPAPAASQSGAQPVQYKSPQGVEYRSLPDTDAIKTARTALAADSKNIQKIIDLGVAESGARQFREAIATFTRGLEIEPNNALLLRWRGHRYLSVREFDRAAADLTRGSKLDPTIYGIWYHLGVLEFVRGDFAAAAAAFAKAQPIAPESGELQGSTDWLWMSLSRAGRGSEAKAMLDRKPDTKPEFTAVTNAYTRRLQLYRDEIKADAVLTSADTDDVQIATLAYALGNWYLLRGDKAQARTYFERSVQSGGWPAFGFIASEAELRRMK